MKAKMATVSEGGAQSLVPLLPEILYCGQSPSLQLLTPSLLNYNQVQYLLQFIHKVISITIYCS